MHCSPGELHPTLPAMREVAHRSSLRKAYEFGKRFQYNFMEWGVEYREIERIDTAFFTLYRSLAYSFVFRFLLPHHCPFPQRTLNCWNRLQYIS